MITDFWFIAAALSLAAVGFVLVPLFRHRNADSDNNEPNRSLLNVELYRERLIELEQSE